MDAVNVAVRVDEVVVFLLLFCHQVTSDSSQPVDCSTPVLSFTVSWSLLKFMPIASVMPSNHLILCHPLLLLPSILPSIRVFSSESALRIRWPKDWGASASASVLPMSMRFYCRNKWSWISVMASRVLFLFFFRFYCICYSIASVLCFDFVGYQACGVFAP